MQKYWGILLFMVISFYASNGHATTPLEAALQAQNDEDKSRYQARHPKQTLTFLALNHAEKWHSFPFWH